MPQNPYLQQTALVNIKHVFVVASGKGGVGKSTVASNLALALSSLDRRVGLLDCDIYGPSLPRMFGLLHQKPDISQENRILPLQKYGIQLMSIGFMVAETSAVIWRGPMLFKAINQFLHDVQWGELDDLVIDLPPGTGDVQLTLSQKIPITGAVVVTTPQNMALADVIKSIDMFKTVNVPVVGIIENMSYLRSDQGNIPLFPKGSLKSYLTENNIPLLGKIPFHTAIALGGETGFPIFHTDPTGFESQIFLKIAESIIRHICLQM